MIRILAVDDHPLLCKGIAALVNAEPDMKDMPIERLSKLIVRFLDPNQVQIMAQGSP